MLTSRSTCPPPFMMSLSSFATAPQPDCRNAHKIFAGDGSHELVMSGPMQPTIASKSVAPGLTRSLRLWFSVAVRRPQTAWCTPRSPASGNRAS